jgi:hypothetical protein
VTCLDHRGSHTSEFSNTDFWRIPQRFNGTHRTTRLN